MFNYINFFFFFFFLSIVSTLVFLNNFFILIFFVEIVWFILIFYDISISLFIDELTSFSISFFIIAFATIELAIGLMFTMLFKKLNQAFFLSSNKVFLERQKNLFFKSLSKKDFFF